MARRTLLLVGLLALAGTAVAACGDDDAGGPEDPCRVVETPPTARELRVPVPLQGLYWGQEVWISWWDPDASGPGYRFPRTREDALERVRELCRAVRAGADLGDVARKHSNGFGGRARGFVVVPEPSHRGKPDARDLALASTPVGELTSVLEWNGGFWFARRVSDRRGRELAALYEHARKVRARARVVHLHHRGAFPRRHEFDHFPKEKAVEKAWWIIRSVKAGKKLEDLAREHSNDNSRSRGGLQVTKDPVTGERTEWIRWGDDNYPQELLDVILEKCPPGELWPEPVMHGRGVSVVQVLEREP